MSDAVSVKLDWNKSSLNALKSNATMGILALGFDIAAEARGRAPYVSGALSNTIRVQQTSDSTIEVIAGGSYGGKKVDYAWIREQGPNRNPATVGYMKNSADHIMSGDYLQKYFGDITK